jgi:hypothetical protein
MFDAVDGWPGGFSARCDDHRVGLDAPTVGQSDRAIVHRDNRADLDTAHEATEWLASVILWRGPARHGGEASHEVVIASSVDDRGIDAEALDGPHGVQAGIATTDDEHAVASFGEGQMGHENPFDFRHRY